MGATTPIYQLPYPVPTDPADVPADMQALANRLEAVFPGLGSGGALSPTPPATPSDGQLWRMSPAAGIVWTFRYNAASASAFKWEFVGGPPLLNEITTQESRPSGAYGDLATVGPQLTLARAGDYLIEHGVTMFNGTAGANLAVPVIGAGTPDDLTAVRIDQAAGALSMAMTGSRSRIYTGLTASVVVKLQYRANAGTVYASGRWLKITPVRVS